MPKISVVLPTYNGSRFLSESIESVINQSFTDWELIIVDDASSDSTWDIAEEYAKCDTRISVIHNNTNVKLPEALNVGFRKAKGFYFAWTSDDNMYLKHAFQVMGEYLDIHEDMTMVCTGMLTIDSNNKIISEYPEYCSTDMFTLNTVGASFLYRRSVWDSLGEYRKDMFCVEDYEYWVRILKNKCRIGYINGCYYLYRKHENSLTSTHRKKVFMQRRLLYLENIDWILHGIRDDLFQLMELYNVMVACNCKCPDNVSGEILSKISELKYEVELPYNNKYIVYGAGNIGELTVNLITDEIICFVDRNKELDGKKKHNYPIYSIDNIANVISNHMNIHVIVAVSAEKQLDAIKKLIELGVNEYSLYTRLF